MRMSHGREAVSLGLNRFTAPRINTLAQLFACFKVGNVLFGHFDTRTRLGVTPKAGRTVVQIKTTESPNFNPLSPRKTRCHGIQKGLNGRFCIFGNEARVAFCELSDEL